MKKISAILLGTLIASSAALAQANQVLSQNAVGYVKVTVPTNGFAMVGIPFNQIGSAQPFSIEEVLGTGGLPQGLQVLIWNPNGSGYIAASYDSEDGWSSGATNRIVPGQGFFIKAPGSTSYTAYIAGEVPGATNESRTVAGGGNLSQFANYFPVAVAFSNLAILANSDQGDQISFWNQSGGYTVFSYDEEDGWPPALLSRVLQPAEAFFFRNIGGSLNWSETKPYTWP